MKKLVVLFCLLAFAMVAPLSMAHEPSKGSKADRVYCCHGKGDCDKLHTKADCEKDGGKVVKDCKECK